MESLTYLKNLDITPKKLRMLLPELKRLSPLEATNILYYSPRRSALVFYKAIKSAIANAKQTLKVNDDLLQFKLFTIEEGNKLKRYQPGSRGSAKPFKKRYSHIKIILVAREERVTPPARRSEAEADSKKTSTAAQTAKVVGTEIKAEKQVVKSRSSTMKKKPTVKKTVKKLADKN